ncbi:MAG: hypothetical protein OCD00_18535 [Colwellia sp.]
MKMINKNSVLKHRLTPEIINSMQQLFENVGATEKGLHNAMAHWPQYRFILCSEDDMGEREAFSTNTKFAIFLIAASLGCASLTHDPSKAVGLIIATYEDD